MEATDGDDGGLGCWDGDSSGVAGRFGGGPAMPDGDARLRTAEVNAEMRNVAAVSGCSGVSG